MKWYIICPIRGLVHTIPDDDKGTVAVIQYCQELANDIKYEGYDVTDIVCLRGERYQLTPPNKDFQLIRKGD